VAASDLGRVAAALVVVDAKFGRPTSATQSRWLSRGKSWSTPDYEWRRDDMIVRYVSTMPGLLGEPTSVGEIFFMSRERAAQQFPQQESTPARAPTKRKQL
jgi:hypothetical protein